MDSCPTTVVLCSLRAWDDIKPQSGDAPEPYHLFLQAPNKDRESGNTGMPSKA